jgi:hypothetical protein
MSVLRRVVITYIFDARCPTARSRPLYWPPGRRSASISGPASPLHRKAFPHNPRRKTIGRRPHSRTRRLRRSRYCSNGKGQPGAGRTRYQYQEQSEAETRVTESNRHVRPPDGTRGLVRKAWRQLTADLIRVAVAKKWAKPRILLMVSGASCDSRFGQDEQQPWDKALI